MKKSHLFILILTVFVIFLIGCTPAQEKKTPAKVPSAIVEEIPASSEQQSVPERPRPSPPPAPAPSPAPEGKIAGNVKEFKVIAKQFSFEPSVIEVNKGDKVRLRLSTIDVPHGFGIPEFGINEVIPEGEEVTAEFTADKQGSFPFLCTVFCGSGHRNMKGTLVVK